MTAPGVDPKLEGVILDSLCLEEMDERGEPMVTPGATLVESLGASSLDKLELLMAIEEAFDLEIPDADHEKLVTVWDLQKYLADAGKLVMLEEPATPAEEKAQWN